MRFTSVSQLEKEKAILDLRRKHQDEIEQLQERYANKVSSILSQIEVDLQKKSRKETAKDKVSEKE